MNIDWFTFTAQVINFLVLVALLRWLLYDRIVNAMQKREERIADRLNSADEARTEADKKAEEYARKCQEIEERREQMLQEARDEAREERQRLLDEARQDVEQRQNQWHETLQREQEDLQADLRRHAGHMAATAARRTLQRLADASLEHQMCEVFDSQLGALSEDERREAMEQLQGDGERVRVTCSGALELSETDQQRLRETIRKQFDYDGTVAFDTSSELICGLELQVGGYSLGWNARRCLDEIEAEFQERLRHQTARSEQQ